MFLAIDAYECIAPTMLGVQVWYGLAAGIGGATCLAAAVLLVMRRRKRSLPAAGSQHVQTDASAAAAC